MSNIGATRPSVKRAARRAGLRVVTPTASLADRDDSHIAAVTKIRTSKYPACLSLAIHREKGTYKAGEHRLLEANPDYQIIARGDEIAEEIGGGGRYG